MKSNRGLQSGEEGKGSLGCIFALILMASVIFLAFKLGPPYFNHHEFKGDLKHTVGRAGASLINNETITKEVKTLALKNNIILKDEEIIIDKSIPTRISIEIKYSIQVDFVIMKRDVHFHIREEGVSII